MFVVPLKTVDSDIPLERLIIQQHELEDKGITEDEIKIILDSSKCLLVFDGYDEYKKGINSAIDTEISSKKGHSFVLITSRPDCMGKKDGRRFYEEIQIRGLSDESIEECIARYFDNQPEATAERCQPEAISNDPLTAVPTTCEGAQPGTTATPIPSSTGKGSQLRTTNEHSSQAKQESQDLINDVKN